MKKKKTGKINRIGQRSFLRKKIIKINPIFINLKCFVFVRLFTDGYEVADSGTKNSNGRIALLSLFCSTKIRTRMMKILLVPKQTANNPNKLGSPRRGERKKVRPKIKSHREKNSLSVCVIQPSQTESYFPFLFSFIFFQVS